MLKAIAASVDEYPIVMDVGAYEGPKRKVG